MQTELVVCHDCLNATDGANCNFCNTDKETELLKPSLLYMVIISVRHIELVHPYKTIHLLMDAAQYQLTSSLANYPKRPFSGSIFSKDFSHKHLVITMSENLAVQFSFLMGVSKTLTSN